MLKKLNDLTGWLNLTQSTNIGDNQFTIAKNVFYNNSKQLQTRRWYVAFGDSIWSDPFTSLFYYRRDDNLERVLVWHAGWVFYRYDEANTQWDAVYSNNVEYETLPNKTSNRTRWDFAVYKNTIYMWDWVNPYQKYDGTTHSLIGSSSVGTATADNTTDIVTKAWHWLSTNAEVYFTTTGTMPWGLVAYQVYYIIDVTTDTFKVTNAKNWTAIDITSNGTWTLTLLQLTEPRCRYISYLSDRLYGCGDDANPSSLYYTNSAPSDWNNINQNVVVVGWDEAWRINGLTEYVQTVIVFKDEKSYGVDVVTPSIQPIDTQNWWYSDRSISNVGNAMVYLTQKGIDSLIKRSGIDWATAIESKPIWDDVRPYTQLIDETQLNANTARYIKQMNNYYFAFDTNNDNRPDKVLVYNSLVSAWTEYVFPALYDFGVYTNSDEELLHLFASATGGQVYQFEYGYDDAGVPIDVHIRTKDFDFDEPAQEKEFLWVELVWYKQSNDEVMNVSIYVDGDNSWSAEITDDNISINDISWGLGVSLLGTDVLWWTEWGITLYPFTVRVPFWVRGRTIAIDIQSTWVQRILEKIRINVNYETVEVFSYDNII